MTGCSKGMNMSKKLMSAMLPLSLCLLAFIPQFSPPQGVMTGKMLLEKIHSKDKTDYVYMDAYFFSLTSLERSREPCLTRTLVSNR
jgi:hypothetical protein